MPLLRLSCALAAFPISAALARAAPTQQPPSDPAAHVVRLAAPEAAQREDARRRLSSLPAEALPRAALAAMLRRGGEAAVAAAQVLAAYPQAHADLRAGIDPATAPPEVLLPAVVALTADELWELLARPLAVAEPRQLTPAGVELADAAVVELACRRALVDARLVGLFTVQEGPLVGCAVRAADLLVHLAPALPLPWLDQVAASEVATQRLLRALADRPRTDTLAWLRRRVADSPDPATRLLAIAALPQSEQSADHAKLVLQLLFDEVPAYLPDFAAARFSSKIADGLVAALHGNLIEGRKASDMLSLLNNVSAAGEAHLLGLAATLPDGEATEVLRWLDVRASAVLRKRLASELDGPAPLAPRWLQFVTPLLDTPARRARVAEFLVGDEDRALLAFQVLLDAQAFAPGMVAIADADPSPRRERVRSLLRLPRAVLPEAVALDYLRHTEPDVRLSAVDFLASGSIADALAERLQALHERDASDAVRGACARALTLAAGPVFAQRAFTQAMGTGYAPGAVEWLLTRPAAFSLPLLRAAREVRASRFALDDLDSARVRFGDVQPLSELLARIGELDLRALRRIAPALAASDEAAITARVHELVLATDLKELAREVLLDALAGQPQRHLAVLQKLYRDGDDDGLRSAALRGLLGTEVGVAMVRALNAAIGQRMLRPDDADLAAEVIGAAPLPLPAEVVELAARLVLFAPLGNPTAEAELTVGDAGEPATYPLIQPLAELIRRDPRAEHGAVLARVLAQARAHPHAHALSRRRLGYLLGYLTLAEPALPAVAPDLAAAIIAAPDVDPSWLGPACLLQAEAAQTRGEFLAAAELFARAQFHCLAHPRSAVQRRRFLADTDVARGQLPLAALSAEAEMLRARAAVVAGDLDLARRCLAQASAHALGDRDVTVAVDKLRRELPQ